MRKVEKLVIHNISEIDTVAKEFIKKIAPNKHVAFYGQMGVGKTTFIKALCKTLGILETVNSPSFAIINEYNTDFGEPVYHFDFYRIKEIEEAYDFGYEDYFYGSNYCFVEWPEKIEPLIPEHFVKVKIEETKDNVREITF